MSARPRRWLSRLGRFWRPPLDLVYSDVYPVHLTSVDALRGERILAALDDAGLLDRRHVHRATPVSFRDLRRVHTDPYLESLNRPGALLPITGVELSEGSQERILRSQRAMAGGTLRAARLALQSGGIAVNLGGGLHHAFADRGERFCAFNDVATAIAALRAEAFAGPILVVDLDLHDGDGTRALFARDATVHTFSIHNLSSPDDPASPPVEATAIELPEGTGDDAFLATLKQRLPPVFARFRPALAFYVAGTDPAADDALGDWKLSARGLLERDLFVVEQTRQAARRPLVVVLSGGYGLGAWRYSARFLGTLLRRGHAFEPLSTEETTLLHYRRIARDLVPADLSGEAAAGDDDWGLTEEDLAGLGRALPHDHRFLGFYTPIGLELALERSGLFERLRDLGFDPTSELDLANPAGETARIFGDARRRELLMEIRVRIDRATVPGFALLAIEWLLLQNPRRQFSPERPRLPGQRHPGLGMLQDVLALMILVCDRLHLDGVVFVPSHYHTAAQGRALRFMDAGREGRFRALREALAGRPLAEATHAVDARRVIDTATGRPFVWEPAPMLLPLSDELAQRFAGDEFEHAAEAARAACRLRVEGVG